MAHADEGLLLADFVVKVGCNRSGRWAFGQEPQLLRACSDALYATPTRCAEPERVAVVQLAMRAALGSERWRARLHAGCVESCETGPSDSTALRVCSRRSSAFSLDRSSQKRETANRGRGRIETIIAKKINVDDTDFRNPADLTKRLRARLFD